MLLTLTGVKTVHVLFYFLLMLELYLRASNFGVETVHVLFYFLLMLELYLRTSNSDWCRNCAIVPLS